MNANSGPAANAGKRRPPLDPVVVHSRREAFWILGTWVVFMIWTVGYSALFGYDISPEELNLILGIPSWAFWGVVLPWIGATLFSIYFSVKIMVDDDLEPSQS